MLQRVMMLTLPLLLTGCLSLDPHYQRPAAPVPANLPQGEAGGNRALVVRIQRQTAGQQQR